MSLRFELGAWVGDAPEPLSRVSPEQLEDASAALLLECSQVPLKFFQPISIGLRKSICSAQNKSADGYKESVRKLTSLNHFRCPRLRSRQCA